MASPRQIYITSSVNKCTFEYPSVEPSSFLTVTISKGYSGYGFVIRGGRPGILECVEQKTAAWNSGLRDGHRIICIDGECAIFMRHDDIIDKLRSKTIVQITVVSDIEPPKRVFKDTSPNIEATYDGFGFEIEDDSLQQPSPQIDSPDSERTTDEEDDESNVDVFEQSDCDSSHVAPPKQAAGDDRVSPSYRKGAPGSKPIFSSPFDHDGRGNGSNREVWVDILTKSNAELSRRKRRHSWCIPERCNSDQELLDFNFLDNPRHVLKLSDNLSDLIYKGIPHDLRRQMWLRCSGAPECCAETNMKYYEMVICGQSQLTEKSLLSQIEKDLMRTFPTNILFNTMESEGTFRLRRILRTLAWTCPEIGYCQGMGMIVGVLLLMMEEDEAYWTMMAFIHKLFPGDYYTKTLMGVMVDQRVLTDLIEVNEPNVYRTLQNHNIDISLVTVNWFLTAYSNVAPLHTVMRVWDCLMVEGSLALFKVALAMITLRAGKITETDEGGDVFNALSDTPSGMSDPGTLLQLSFSFMHVDPDIPALRAKHRERLQAELEDIERRRQDHHAKKGDDVKGVKERKGPTMASKLFGAVKPRTASKTNPSPFVKAKNIMRTEILVNCIHAVENLERHFAMLEREEREEQQERARLAQEVKEFLLRKEGKANSTPLDDGGDAEEPQVVKVVGDEKRCPSLRPIIDGLLGHSLISLIGHEMSSTKTVSAAHAWDFLAFVGNTDSPEKVGLHDDQQMHETWSAFCAAVRSVERLLAGNSLSIKSARVLAVVRWALNKGCLADWFQLLGEAASHLPGSKWYRKHSFMKQKAVNVQVCDELQRLNSLAFKLNIDPHA
eukprot:m.72902 g.72902  ORF g.72902 m.72902 type:complete len:835 (-) comp12365_c0_seq5:105-2609(-)